MYNRFKMVEVMNGWLGATSGSKLHRTIVDLYNMQKPLPRGYKLKMSDAWCAATVSAAAVALGYLDIIPGECSCGKMIDALKALGEWVEDDSYTPAPGDLIFYYWGDDGIGEYNGNHASHVGVVESVNNGLITTIEGNYNDKVQKRFIQVNGRYIRGYGVPKYDDVECESTPDVYYVAVKGDTVSALAKRFQTTKEELIRLNRLKAPYWLYAGKKYRVK